MMRILHVITDLDTGGAEMSLCRLLAGMDRERFSPAVLSLKDHGTQGDRIANLGVPVYTAGLHTFRPRLPRPASLVRAVRTHRPDVIQGWMYHGNLAALGLVSICPGRRPALVWNIRHSVYDVNRETRLMRGLIAMGARFSRSADGIVYNAHISTRQHEQLGYASRHGRVIPNGFDTSEFKPDQYQRQWLRDRLGLPGEAVLIGNVARFHPMKDHNNFLRAAAVLAQWHVDVQFVLVGSGVDGDNPDLARWIATLGLRHRVHLLGEQTGMARLHAAMDITTMSSSHGEGFSNVLGEAMSCGIPCVATDVGDAGLLVGETGRIVPPGDPQALATAWDELLAMGRPVRIEMGNAARRRIDSRFSLRAMVSRYEEMYDGFRSG